MSPRHIKAADVPRLAALWHQGWHEAHREIVPVQLTAQRRLESFEERLNEFGGEAWLIDADDGPVALCLLREDELYQFYVAPEARSTGVARAMMAHAVRRFHALGFSKVWLACAVGNHRAARFYEKSGWQNVGTERFGVDVEGGSFPISVWRFEKML